jgi:thioesterase domain-containing protein
MTWLLNHRTDFSDNGWAQLATGPFKNGIMGGHHFSMMKEPHAAQLGQLIREGLDWKP